MNTAKKNVGVLAVCQALLNSNNSMLAVTAALVGYSMLGSDKTLATVPVSAMVIGTAIATMPAALLMRRIGRRAGFRVGILLGITGASVSAFSLFSGNFWLFTFGILLLGMNTAFGQHYRFAAADVATRDFKAKAISYVLAGGVIAAWAGPEIAKWTVDIIPNVRFLGPYLAMIVVSMVAFVTLGFVDIPRPTEKERAEVGRPFWEIARQPVFYVAALSALIGFSVMVLLMTATPIAMLHFNHEFHDAAFVIQWHAVAMFAPSFFTGTLINRFGVLAIILTGVGMMSAAIVTALLGDSVPHFWVTLVLVGIGWNFMFIGGTTLLTESYTEAEKAKVQGANDMIVFGMVAVSSLSSGILLQTFGWGAVVLGAIPLVAVAGVAVVVFAFLRRQRAAAAT